MEGLSIYDFGFMIGWIPGEDGCKAAYGRSCTGRETGVNGDRGGS